MKDINLQEAVRRREEQLPPMPSDLNERLMNSLTPHPSPRRVELKRLLLVAASLVLVVGIGFKFLRLPKQTETKVVQVVEREEQPAKNANLSQSLSQEEEVAIEEPSVPASEETMEVFVELPDPYLALEAQVQDIRSRGERFSQEVALLMDH